MAGSAPLPAGGHPTARPAPRAGGRAAFLTPLLTFDARGSACVVARGAAGFPPSRTMCRSTRGGGSEMYIRTTSATGAMAGTVAAARLSAAGLLVLAATTLTAGPVFAAHTNAPASVTVAGSLQEELGCSGDWQPDCADTHLAF